MGSIEDALEYYQNSKQNRVRIIDSMEDRERLTSLSQRKEESCKLEDDQDFIDEQSKDNNNPAFHFSRNEYGSSMRISDHMSQFSHNAEQKVNRKTGMKLSFFVSQPKEDNNLNMESKQTSFNEVYENDYENQSMNKKSVTNETQSIQLMDISHRLTKPRPSRLSRAAGHESSIKLAQNSQLVKNQPINMQKELMNRFLILHQRQRNQITKLDAIVILKTKLNNFFQSYTNYGRARLMKKNHRIRKSVNDLSDGQLLLQNQGLFDKFEGVTQQISKYLLRQNKNNWRYCSALGKYSCFIFTFLNKFIKFSKGTISHVEIFKPHNSLLLAFNLFCLIMNFIFLYILSLLIAFESIMNIPDYFIKNYFLFNFILWIIEFFVRINTAETFRTSYIQNRMRILKSYAKSGLALDLIPLVLLLVSIDFKQVRPLIFLKYFGMLKDVEKVEKSLLMLLNKRYYIQMFNLTLNIFIFGHVIGLLYYEVAVLQLDYFGETKSWLDTRIAVEGQWYKIYLQSVYWSFTLLTTGSNDVETWEEMFFTTFIMMYTGAIFAYIFNTIGNIISEMNELVEEKKKDINIINNFMKRRKISRELQHKANEDLEFFYQTSFKKQSDDEKEVLAKISSELSQSMQLEYNRKIVSKIKLLTDNFSQQSIDQMCLKIEESFYSPNQIIFQSNSTIYQSPQLFFIVSGRGKSSQIHTKQLFFKSNLHYFQLQQFFLNSSTNILSFLFS